MLTRAESVANANLAVVRTTRNVNGQTVPSVRFQSSLNGAEAVWEFDAATGLLLFYRRSTPNPNTGTTLLEQSTFVNLRTLPLPWTPDQAPNWVRPNVKMNYSGTQSNTIPGAGTIPSSYALATTIAQATPTWSTTNGSTFLNGAGTGDFSLVTGVGLRFGGYWLPRAATQAQIPTTETIIDSDPVTGVETMLSRAPNGGIVLRETDLQGGAFETILLYDPVLGSLDEFQQRISSPTNVTVTHVVRNGGDDLAALNQQPELPRQQTMFLPGLLR